MRLSKTFFTAYTVWALALMMMPLQPVCCPNAGSSVRSGHQSVPFVLPNTLRTVTVPSDRLLSHTRKLADRLAALNVNRDQVHLSFEQPIKSQLTMILRQIKRSGTGQHFIPLSNDGDGVKVYAMELSRPWTFQRESNLRFYRGANGEKRFALLSVRYPSLTALTLSTGHSEPNIGLIGLVDVSEARIYRLSNIANKYSDLLQSHSLEEFLLPR